VTINLLITKSRQKVDKTNSTAKLGYIAEMFIYDHAYHDCNAWKSLQISIFSFKRATCCNSSKQL